ncbi:MAG: NAD(P)H-dependent oxidoreductase [Nitrososphaeria archaeon]|jgi:NAD(P)H-dependent FMN reductase
MSKHVILLIGSPKSYASTSNALGDYLIKKLEKQGFVSDKIYIYDAMKTDKDAVHILQSIDDADLLILTFPLYVDNIPSQVIALLELIFKHRSLQKEPKKQKILSLSNSGFPEASQSETAHAICRKFASETKIEWIGGLALGGGGAIGGTNLEDVGRIGGGVRKALELVANSICEDKPLPDEALKLMKRPLVSPLMYTWFGDAAWKKAAKENGVENRLYERPYQASEDS